MIDKGILINNIISEFKTQPYNKIYSSIMGFESPFAIGIKGSKKGFYPDIIIEKDDAINIISVETKIEKNVSKKDAERWGLFQLFTKANKGDLYIAGSPHTISIIKNGLQKIPSNLKFIQLV